MMENAHMTRVTVTGTARRSVGYAVQTPSGAPTESATQYRTEAQKDAEAEKSAATEDAKINARYSTVTRNAQDTME